MHEHKCKSCVFFDTCEKDEVCLEIPCPDMDWDDEMISLWHEHQKVMFYKEWIEYTEEFYE